MPNRTDTARIVIADDHPIFRNGLKRLLESEGFSVVAEAEDGAAAVTMVERLSPDILLLDVAMPRVTGIAALEHLAKLATPVKTILLTAAIDTRDIVSALQFGARGVLLKDAATELLFKCIRTVLGGQYWVGREPVSNLVQTLRELMASTDAAAKRQTFGLTKREMAIVGAIVEGHSNKDI